VLAAFVRIVTPLVVVVAGYLVWVGGHAPGGAFQAGALLAGACVMLLLTGKVSPGRLSGWTGRLLLVLGVLTFLGIGLAAMTGGAFLDYPEGLAKPLIFIIEAVATLSIGLVLALLFAACTYGEQESRS
jgi:multisubunit Na+/H+ antiporter MnhB subunit